MSTPHNRAVETILAAFLTDGHFNGVSIGIRCLDPMVFKALIDEGLIRTVFPVRGTGETWSLGAYFSAKASREVLSLIGWKQGAANFNKLKIPDNILEGLDIRQIAKWVIELEGGSYLHFWGMQPFIGISLVQYEPLSGFHKITSYLNSDANLKRIRASVAKTRDIIRRGLLVPSRIWADVVLERFRKVHAYPSLYFYKAYGLDIYNKLQLKASLVHQFYIIANCKADPTLFNLLLELTVQGSWKNLKMRIECEVMKSFLSGEIYRRDVALIKAFLRGSKSRLLKGPYNEFILSRLPLIEDKIIGRAKNKLQKLKRYLLTSRKKSLKYFQVELSEYELRRFIELAERLPSLKLYIEEVEANMTF